MKYLTYLLAPLLLLVITPNNGLAGITITGEDQQRRIVFPNPSNEIFTFRVNGLEEDLDAFIRIDDINSRSIYETTMELHANQTGEFIWNASKINAGIYYYQIKLSNGKGLNGKLIKL